MFKKNTPNKVLLYENQKLKRHPPKIHVYMLRHYIGEEEGKEKEKEQITVGHGKCSKCFTEMNHDIYIKQRKICKSCWNQNRTK